VAAEVPRVGAEGPGLADTMLLNALAKATNCAISVGYCCAQPMTASVFHVYPENGVATL
jgi:hypothetical protein